VYFLVVGSGGLKMISTHEPQLRMETHPDIFQAAKEPLGLRLEPAKGDVDFLVIDHLNKMPTGN
jgi:uncharacterized protein (TIGR03435 family)